MTLKNKQGRMPFELAILFNNYNIAAYLIPPEYQEEHPSIIEHIKCKQKNNEESWDHVINKDEDAELQ